MAREPALCQLFRHAFVPYSTASVGSRAPSYIRLAVSPSARAAVGISVPIPIPYPQKKLVGISTKSPYPNNPEIIYTHTPQGHTLSVSLR